MIALRHPIASIHPLVRAVPPELRAAVLKRVFHSAAHRFIYFRVPKAANSTVVMSLATAMGAAPRDHGGASAKRSGNAVLRLALGLEARLAESFKFTFVRHPYARVLSAYLDKIATGRPEFRRIVGLDDRPLSFAAFLHRLDDGYLTANIHWAPQTVIVALPPDRLDFVGRVESLDADLAQVLDRIFGPAGHGVVRRVEGVRSASGRLAEFYGPAERRLVQKLYAGDFELFYPDA
jgi:hypothetical protein